MNESKLVFEKLPALLELLLDGGVESCLFGRNDYFLQADLVPLQHIVDVLVDQEAVEQPQLQGVRPQRLDRVEQEFKIGVVSFKFDFKFYRGGGLQQGLLDQVAHIVEPLKLLVDHVVPLFVEGAHLDDCPVPRLPADVSLIARYEFVEQESQGQPVFGVGLLGTSI